MKPLSLAPHQPQCEPIFELLAGPHGRLCVGHMLKGTDTGRVVMLRELADASERISAAVDIARSIAHPRISKVLGIAHGAQQSYLTSEYTPGVSLHELGTAVRRQQTRLKAAAAARIIREALKAAAVAEQLLSKAAGVAYARTIFADTIWIAEYGDVLVTEVGLAPLLNETHAASSALDAQARDVVAAGMELFQLCTGQLMTMDVVAKLRQLPPALAAVLGRALIEPASFAGPLGFCAALEGLPAPLQGTEQQVAEELRRVMRATLETRRHTLNAMRQSSVQLGAQIGEEEVTQFSRPSGAVASTTRDTARPPPGLSLPELAAATGEGDELTTIFLRSPAAPSGLPSLEAPGEPEWQSAPTRVEALVFHEAPVVEPSELDSQPPESNPFRPSAVRRPWLVFALLAVVALLALLRSYYLHLPLSPH
jgi:serine/threonine protein kinase